MRWHHQGVCLVKWRKLKSEVHNRIDVPNQYRLQYSNIVINRRVTHAIMHPDCNLGTVACWGVGQARGVRDVGGNVVRDLLAVQPLLVRLLQLVAKVHAPASVDGGARIVAVVSGPPQGFKLHAGGALGRFRGTS